jgi:multidrug efflux pump subunit AcrB
LLVDNGIVVVENITRYLRMGLSPGEAAVKGTAEVGWALVSATVTTLLAFFPMTQLGGGTGQFIKTLPLIVIFSLVASLILALAFTPVVAGRIAKANAEGKLSRAERFMQGLVERVYRPALRWSLRYPIVVLAIGLGTLAGSFALFPLVGVSFFPTADKPMLLIDVDLPEGSSLEKTDEVARFVESVLEKQDYVQAYATNVGHGNPQVYYNIIPSNLDPTHAQFLLKLDDWEAEPFYQLVDSLRADFAGYPDPMIAVTELKNGPPYEAPIEIKVIGENLENIKTLAAQVETIISNTEGTINTDNPLAFSKTNLRVAVNRPKADLSGVSLADIDLRVRTAINGSTVGSLQAKDGNEYDIVMRLPLKGDSRMSDFNRIHVASPFGGSASAAPGGATAP